MPASRCRNQRDGQGRHRRMAGCLRGLDGRTPPTIAFAQLCLRDRFSAQLIRVGCIVDVSVPAHVLETTNVAVGRVQRFRKLLVHQALRIAAANSGGMVLRCRSAICFRSAIVAGNGTGRVIHPRCCRHSSRRRSKSCRISPVFRYGSWMTLLIHGTCDVDGVGSSQNVMLSLSKNSGSIAGASPCLHLSMISSARPAFCSRSSCQALYRS